LSRVFHINYLNDFYYYSLEGCQGLKADMLVFHSADIEGSTRLWEEHAKVMTSVIARHDQILQQTVSSAGGCITKHTGDGITATGPVWS
jgi:class 3 adenylate cyclase